MKIYLFICTRHREFGIFVYLRYLRLSYALQGTLFWKKMILYEIFQLVHAPTWKILHYMTGFFIHMCKAWSVRFLWLFFALSATLLCLVRYIVWKKMIPQYMNCFLFICTRHRLRYLQLFFAICDSLMFCKVHYFGKRYFFHEIFQVGACPNLKDPFLYDRFSIHMYKAWIIRYFQHFSSVCDSLMPSKVHLFEKDEFVMEYFKLVHAPTWKIP